MNRTEKLKTARLAEEALETVLRLLDGQRVEVRHDAMMGLACALWLENDSCMSEAAADGKAIVRCGNCGTRHLPAAKCPWCLIDQKSYVPDGRKDDGPQG